MLSWQCEATPTTHWLQQRLCVTSALGACKSNRNKAFTLTRPHTFPATAAACDAAVALCDLRCAAIL